MDPRDGRGAAAAVRDAMVDETISSNGEPGTKEAEALAAALNHSAERVQTLWFSFLTFMLYLAVATGTTTHRMLFLEEALNLPVLNIKLPLLGFYILTPVIFVVLHFYMLLNLVLLARTARSFEDSLARAFLEDGEPRENFRMRIENTLFVQLLVGGRLERAGINAKLLSAMSLITLALAPVALLLMFEVKFLPYHSEWITWLHRGLLALDLALVWTLWPGYRSGWGVRLCPEMSWRLAVPGVLSAAALSYVVLVATFPDERMYLARLDGIAPVNTLDLHGQDLIEDAKLTDIQKKNESSTGEQRWVATLPLAGRDLTGADLSSADVRQVDFSGAILNRADLHDAWAREAHFVGAQLQGASLGGAHLQGASLDFARLQGAVFWSAQLQGASLERARLQGALLDGAQLQGASLEWAQLQGARLEDAWLQGAFLEDAELQGAFLDKAQLQGATLDRAKLQGASLEQAQLQGSSFGHAFVWRADAGAADWKDTRVAGAKTGSKTPCQGKDGDCAWTADIFEALKRLIADQVPEKGNIRLLLGNQELVSTPEVRHQATERIDPRLDPNKALGGEEKMAAVWADHERSAPRSEVYEKSAAEQWRKTGCAAEGAPYVVRRLLRRLGITLFPFLIMHPLDFKFGKDSPEKPKNLFTIF